MVREPTLRKKKYESNVDPETLSRQITAVKPLMVQGQSVYFPQIAEVERKVKQICEESGVSTIQVAQYINFGRQLYSLSNKFRGNTLQNEACAFANMWVARGLDNILITNILNLFGINCPALPTTCYNPCVHGSNKHDATVLDTVPKLLAQNIRQTYNRAAGIIPTFTTFDVNPSNPERITDGNFLTETGEGTKSLAGVNGDVGRVFFDLGASYPVLILLHWNMRRISGDGTIACGVARGSGIDGSGVDYGEEYGVRAGAFANYYRMAPTMFTYTRLIRIRFYTASVTVNPSVFGVKLCEFMAIQLI